MKLDKQNNVVPPPEKRGAKPLYAKKVTVLEPEFTDAEKQNTIDAHNLAVAHIYASS